MVEAIRNWILLCSELLVLFPFFAIKNSLNCAGSALGQMFARKKDMFYRFLSNEDINRQPKSLAKLKSLITRALLYNIQEARSTVWGYGHRKEVRKRSMRQFLIRLC